MILSQRENAAAIAIVHRSTTLVWQQRPAAAKPEGGCRANLRYAVVRYRRCNNEMKKPSVPAEAGESLIPRLSMAGRPPPFSPAASHMAA